MLDVFDTSPLLHRFIQPLLHNRLKGFESFDYAALAEPLLPIKAVRGVTERFHYLVQL